MPYVLRLSGNTYFAGPVSMAEMGPSVALSRTEQKPVPLLTSRDIDSATRIPMVFGVLAQLKQDTLKTQGVRTTLVYDMPQPLKLLRRLLPF